MYTTFKLVDVGQHTSRIWIMLKTVYRDIIFLISSYSNSLLPTHHVTFLWVIKAIKISHSSTP